MGFAQQPRGHRQVLLTFERPDKSDQKDTFLLTQTNLEQIKANVQFREVARFFESVHYLHLVPQLVRRPHEYQGATAGDPFGRSFLEALAKTPEKTQKARLRRIETALRKAVPQFEDLRMERDESGTPHLSAVYKRWRPKAGRQREDQFSDGTLRLIGLLWALLEGDSMLLLEEPELSLNAEIVKRIPGMLHRIQRKRARQIILTKASVEKRF